MSHEQTPGARGVLSRVVTAEDTARAVGSGTVDVLGTPVLIAWLEAASLEAVAVPPGSVSVGVRVDVSHLRATTVGDTLTCSAELESVSGKRMTFVVSATDSAGNVVADGHVHRVVVDQRRFLDGV